MEVYPLMEPSVPGNAELRNESRRACPELVERGRLNLAQDVVLGSHAPSKSPEGTTETSSDPKLSIERLQVSRPYGTFPSLKFLTQDCVPG
jgi:hypothetical protein